MRPRASVRLDQELVDRARHVLPQLEFSVYVETLLLADLDRRSTNDGFSWSDEARTLTALAFRTGSIRELKAGRRSPLLEDRSLRRLSEEDLQRLLNETSTQLEALLRLRDQNPAAYALLLRRARAQDNDTR